MNNIFIYIYICLIGVHISCVIINNTLLIVVYIARAKCNESEKKLKPAGGGA